MFLTITGFSIILALMRLPAICSSTATCKNKKCIIIRFLKPASNDVIVQFDNYALNSARIFEIISKLGFQFIKSQKFLSDYTLTNEVRPYIFSDYLSQYKEQSVLKDHASFHLAYLGALDIPGITPILKLGHLSPSITHVNEPINHTTLIFSTSLQRLSEVVILVIKHFKWKQFCILKAVAEYGKVDKSVFDFLYFELKRHRPMYHPKVLLKQIYSNITVPHLKDVFIEIIKTHRIVVLCLEKTLAKFVIRVAQHSGKYGKFIFVLVDTHQDVQEIERPWLTDGNNDDNVTQRLRLGFESVLRLTYEVPSSLAYTRFLSTFRKQLREKRASNSKLKSFGSKEVEVHLAYFYDAFVLYAKALNHTLRTYKDLKKIPPIEIIKFIKSQTFQGISGNLSFTKWGDLYGRYILHSYHLETDKFEPVGYYDGKTGKFELVGSIVWPGSTVNKTPTDKPLVDTKTNIRWTDGVVAAKGFTVFIIIYAVCILMVSSFFAYKHYLFESDMNRMHWLVKWTEICAEEPEKETSNVVSVQASETSDENPNLLQNRDSKRSLGSIANPFEKQVYAQVTTFRNVVVAIKKLQKTTFVLNKTMLLEVKLVRDMNNEHICRFIAACIDVPHQCLLYEYCDKGSLQDLLENEKVKLDWIFQYSLIKDIARGMEYLHGTEVHSHGNLKSSNCLVDSRFVVKISNFGLHSLRDNVEDKQLSEYDTYKRKQWTSPELLRMEQPQIEGTQKSDVYSFGIICQEIVYRKGVFYIENRQYTPQEIIENVILESDTPFRPTIHRTDVQAPELVKLIKLCWRENPDERYDFRTLRFELRKITKDGGNEGNILDSLLRRMEVYANNLEALVDIRTSQVEEQKKKTEALLYNMLPRKVAEQLIQGMSVEAEAFDCVTIYFSDICGFTDISAHSSPIQIVDLLNSLYSLFDGIIENYDIYKVETIGDAYMVVSGLPQPNGILHAREIARMALTFIDALAEFTIPHRPDEKLKLRIGMHSGPVCSGVVGHKMPRYCLFGDTVNTASRMETTGRPNHMHISAATKELLDEFHTFYYECRGEIDVKGKGFMRTYWLLGETCPDTPLKVPRKPKPTTWRASLEHPFFKPQMKSHVNGIGKKKDAEELLKIRPKRPKLFQR